MNLRTATRLAVLLTGSIAAACGDRLDSPAGPPATADPDVSLAPQQGEGVVEDQTIGLEAIPRFYASLTVSGSLSPGSPIQITLSAQGNLSTEEVELRLLLPEVEAAKTSEFGPGFQIPVNVPLPAVQRWIPLVAGQEAILPAIVSIPAPGYYRVVASIMQRSGEPQLYNGEWVQNVAHRTLWLWIAEQGGRITSRFDESLFPPNAVIGPGPLRFLTAPTLSPPSQTSRASILPDLRPILRSLARFFGWRTKASYSVQFQVLYLDYNTGQNRPLADAIWEVVYTDYSDPYNPKTKRRSGSTDSNGEFSLGCPDIYESTFDGSVYTKNFRVIVQPNSGTNKVAGFVVHHDDCYEPQFIQLYAHDSELSHVLQNMTAAAGRPSSLFGRTRASIPVVVQEGSTSCQDSSSSCYSTGKDKIFLLSDTTSRGTAARDHVWGQWGFFVQFHEYGHAYQWKGLEPPASYSCVEPHTLGGQNTRSCAFAEGFADFFAAWVGGSELVNIGGSDYDIEANPYRDNGDGLLIEGAVAGFWYDLVDNASDPNGSNNQSTGSDDEAVSFPGSYIADVLRTCEVQSASTWITKLDGLDQFIYCSERALDADDAATPYSSAWRAYNGFRESATEPAGWSKTVVRNQWLRNLYNQ